MRHAGQVEVSFKKGPGDIPSAVWIAINGVVITMARTSPQLLPERTSPPSF
jgi:hypothetical protein